MPSAIRGVLLLALAAPACSGGGEKPGAAPAVDFSAYPAMRCQVVFARGSFFGFQPPQREDPFYLDLGQLAAVKKLEFDAKRGSYIPLLEPFRVERATALSEKEVMDLRLVSNQAEGRRILMDIGHYDAAKPSESGVWIIEEDKIVRSAAYLQCRFEAKGR